MLSVKKEEFFSSGLIGICCIVWSILNLIFPFHLVYGLVLVALVVVYFVYLIYRKKAHLEPWDELTQENYAKARRFTSYLIEFSLLIFGICLVFTHSISITANYILLYYGCIKVIQMLAFFYFDTKDGRE